MQCLSSAPRHRWSYQARSVHSCMLVHAHRSYSSTAQGRRCDMIAARIIDDRTAQMAALQLRTTPAGWGTVLLHRCCCRLSRSSNGLLCSRCSSREALQAARFCRQCQQQQEAGCGVPRSSTSSNRGCCEPQAAAAEHGDSCACADCCVSHASCPGSRSRHLRVCHCSQRHPVL